MILHLVLKKNILSRKSRPHLRKASNHLTAEMGVYQHHDAIAGTAKQAVANDYALRLSRGLK
jgi:hypothetical protein